MAKEVYRVGITGSYGGLNLGDEAILQSVIVQLRRDLPVEITVFSRDAEDTKRRHGVERAVPVRLRCLLPRDTGRLVVAGRCISGRHEAHSSCRVMPIVMATGQAAGVCAALASREDIHPRDVEVRDVQRELVRQGASLRRDLVEPALRNAAR